MKATSKTQAPLEVAKSPATVGVREIVPWMIIAVMIFAFAGVVTGWTLRSGNIAEVQAAATAMESKDASR